MTAKPARAAQAAAGQARSSPALKVMARVGFAVSGLLHLILGWIVIQMGTGGQDGEDADQSGAMSQIAAQPFGAVMLTGVAVGLVALAIWHALAAVRASGLKDRLKPAGQAVVHLALAVLAAGVVLGTDGGADEESLTGAVMSYPLGRLAIAAVGGGIIIAGVVHGYIAWTKKFQDHLSAGGQMRRVVVMLGRLGYAAKGLALAVLGALFITAAVTADAEEAGGLDGAFTAIGEQPFGAVLLVITGAGIACYGLLCFAQVRYERL